MLTPQQVQEKCFSKATFGGYDMGEVDDFLDSLTEDYSALYKENALLKSKMKLLVDKVEEYRASEESVKQAIQSAKAMAAQIVEDAKKQSAVVQDPQVAVAGKELEQLRAEVAQEQSRLADARRQTAEFVAEMKSVLRAEVELLSGIKDLPAAPEAPARVVPEAAAVRPAPVFTPAAAPVAPVAAEPVRDPDVVDDTVRAIEDNVFRIMGDTPEVEPEPAVAAMAAAPDLDENDAMEHLERAEKNRTQIFAEIQRETADIFREPEFPDPVVRSKEAPKAAAPAAEETPADPNAKPKPRFTFTNLQFGKDYEIK